MPSINDYTPFSQFRNQLYNNVLNSKQMNSYTQPHEKHSNQLLQFDYSIRYLLIPYHFLS